MINTGTLNTHKCRNSRKYLRLHTIGKRYENPQVVLSIYKDFSTIMRSSKEFLRVSIIIEEPSAKIKIVLINHNLK